MGRRPRLLHGDVLITCVNDKPTSKSSMTRPWRDTPAVAVVAQSRLVWTMKDRIDRHQVWSRFYLCRMSDHPSGKGSLQDATATRRDGCVSYERPSSQYHLILLLHPRSFFFFSLRAYLASTRSLAGTW